ncbi:MAG: hypothetical protein ACLFVC_08585 [Opitutales bacterium]
MARGSAAPCLAPPGKGLLFPFPGFDTPGERGAANWSLSGGFGVSDEIALSKNLKQLRASTLVQKRRPLQGRPAKILDALKPFLEDDGTPDENVPVRSAYRDLSNRLDQLDYPSAIRAELPIGSGLIEGGHRHVLRKRLKISGAWWKLGNLYAMAHLRVCRANQNEDQYWRDLRKAA